MSEPTFNVLKHPNFRWKHPFHRQKQIDHSEWIKKCLDRGNAPVVKHDMANPNRKPQEEYAKVQCRLFKERFGVELDYDILVGGVMYLYKKC